MKTLLILRHAKSSWKDMSLSDHDRPLNKRGKGDAPRMGRLLRDEGLVPDQIISSTAVRAKTTALVVADASGFTGQLRLTRDLYHADAETYVAVLRRLNLADDCIMVVGHNPGMSELVYELTGVFERMPTGAIAQVELPIRSWKGLRLETVGRLVGVFRPKEI